MSTLTTMPIWHALEKHQQEIKDLHLRDLFQSDPKRATHFSLNAAELFLDYSKNRITQKTLELLCHLAESIKLSEKISAMFTGELVNNTEQRPALHTALRNLSDHPIFVNNQNVMPLIKNNLTAIEKFTEKVRNKNWLGFNRQPITDIVNIGIGGSDLGPALTTQALAPYAIDSLQLHFVSNVDSLEISHTLKKINPATTLFFISSKSFTTLDTLTNAATAKNWFIQKTNQTDLTQHFFAITHNAKKAVEFGIAPENIFPIWEWVGGRYSLWSAVGLPIVLAIGAKNFRELLAGAYAMDQHFRLAPFQQNMPVILGLLSIWYNNFFKTQAHAILPYDQSLHLLPAYLQQANMESSGKQVQKDGTPVDYHTGAIIFGTPGTNGQHTFYQLLHQGTHLIPVDFIAPVKSHYPQGEHQTILFANCLSQSKALMEGKTHEEVREELLSQGYNEKMMNELLPHKLMPGNRPSNTITFSQLTPYTLGALLALYEHKIFTECAIWQINAFDQWSVELGKQLAKNILSELTDKNVDEKQDASTRNLIAYYQQNKT